MLIGLGDYKSLHLLLEDPGVLKITKYIDHQTFP